MTVKKSERLIVKFITDQANQEEIEELTKWLKIEESQIVFRDFVKTNYAIDTAMYSFDSNEVKRELSERIQQEKSVFYKRRFSSYYKYAAILIMVLGSFYFYKKSSLFNSKDNVVVPRQDEIVLQLDNESVQTIDPSNEKNVTDKFGKVIGKQDKNRLVYSKEVSNGKLVYNTLIVPYGKTFEVQLSDGTVVHLNSGTTLKYPVQFVAEEKRQVFLDGEAYFEVTKDPKHPFAVTSKDMDIQVLGTKFNVTSYTKDQKTYTVLVEGSVLAKNNLVSNDEVLLKPGNRVYFDNKNLKTEPVDVRKHIAWISGELMFIDDSFAVISNKLERKYNVEIINNYKALDDIMVTATFKDEDIYKVLKTFQTYKPFEFTINNRIITITKPKKM
jgi:transmembrane sensor